LFIPNKTSKPLANKARYYCTDTVNKFPMIDINTLEVDKIFVYKSDKQTLTYVFNNCVEAARKLTPKRVAHLSNLELNKNKTYSIFAVLSIKEF
jgi:hypothetical protein